MRFELAFLPLVRSSALRFHVGRLRYEGGRSAPEAPTERARAKLQTIPKRTVDGLSVGDEDAVSRDRELPGFGVRPSGVKVYVAQCRAEGNPGGLAATGSSRQARREAALVIARGGRGSGTRACGQGYGGGARGAVSEGIRGGALQAELGEALPPGARQARLVGLRQSRRRGGRARIGAALPPAGHQANRVLESKLFNLAEIRGLRREGGNPCRFVCKYKERKRERFLSDEEFRVPNAADPSGCNV